MDRPYSFQISVLGPVQTHYPAPAVQRPLSQSKRTLLAALVAASHEGIRAPDLLPLSGGQPPDRAALSMAVSRLRDHLPIDSLPPAVDGRYVLQVDPADVDVWALRELATGGQIDGCSVEDLFHLLRPVLPFSDATTSLLTDAYLPLIAQHQRDLIRRLAEGRADLLNGGFVHLLDQHLAVDPHNEQLLEWVVTALVDAGDRRGALDRLAAARAEMVDLGLDLNEALTEREQDLLHGRVNAPVPGQSRDELPPQLERMLSDGYVEFSRDIRRICLATCSLRGVTTTGHS